MAKKRDEGHEETEKVLADIEKEISKEYAQAEKEISEKLDDYLRRFEVKDKIKYNAWQEGKITEAEYKQWRLGQVAVGERWQEMKDSLAQDFTNAAEIGKSITDGHMPEVYAINHNYGTYQVEQTAHVDTSYTLYDRQSVEHLFKGEGKLYHDYGIKTGIAIAEGKQQAWDRKQIQSVMTQALLQGESIGKIATRLSKTVGDSDRKACIRNARTMTTGVQNAGRVDSYKRAESMGIELEQEWLATLDSRTRHEHRMLDGQRVKVGEKFKVDGYELAFPADPEGEAFLVYNCRCTLVPALKGFNVDSSDTSLRHTDYMNEQSYDEWKESHYIISDPITKQDDIAEIMKESYTQDYKYLAGQNPYTPTGGNTPTPPSNTQVVYPQNAQAGGNAPTSSRDSDSFYNQFDGLQVNRPNRSDYEGGASSEAYREAREKYKEDRDKVQEITNKWYDENFAGKSITKEEFAEWCENNHVKMGDIDGMDMEALKAYTERYEQLSKDFPIVNEWRERNGWDFTISFKNDMLYDAEASNGMTFGTPYSAGDFRGRMYQSLVSSMSNDFVRGANPAVQTFDHEFGHNVYFAITQYAETGKSKEDYQRIAEFKKDFFSLCYGKKGMSEYATTNDDELFAEAFCAWYGGEQTEFAKGMGELLRKWGYVK